MRQQRYVSKKAALWSDDPNRILMAFAKRSAIRLYYHSLNVTSAIYMPKRQLLALSGIGPKTLRDVQMAWRTANKGGKGKRFRI